MRLFDQVRKLKEELTHLALEPERVEAWLAHLHAYGISAEIEWRPETLNDAVRFSRTWLGRIRLHSAPINCIELTKNVSAQETRWSGRTNQAIFYEDHFLIEAPERGVIVPVRAKRVPKRSFGLFGKIQGYQWRGGPLAQRFALDAALERILSGAVEGTITIHFDKNRRAVCIARRYVGMTTHATRTVPMQGDGEEGTILGKLMKAVGVLGSIQTDYRLPSPEVLGAYLDMAREIRKYAGLPAM